MYIKRSSWHYKLNRFFCGYDCGYELPPKTLCKYFWQTMLSILIIILIILFSICSIYIIIYIVKQKPYILILSISIISITFIPLLTIEYLRANNCGKPIGKFEIENIFYSYIKAQKKKVCPTITYID